MKYFFNLGFTLLVLIAAFACSRKEQAFFAPSRHADWSGTTAGNHRAVASTQPTPTTQPSVAPLPAETKTAATKSYRPGVVARRNAEQNSKARFHYSKKHPALPIQKVASSKDDGSILGTLSLVFGIVGFVLAWIIWPVGLLLGLAAIILGIIGLTKIEQGGRGRGSSIAGIVLGGLTILIPVLIVIIILSILF